VILIRKFYISLLTCIALTTNAQSRIVYFNAVPMVDSVRLNFTISAGTGCAGYNVLKGSDSISLYPVYVYGGICGNTSSQEYHTYSDISPNKSSPNYYRILIPPGDYSKILRVDLASSNSNMIIYPQPTEDVLNIVLLNKKNYYYEIKIYDRYGRKMGEGSGDAVDKISLNVSGFPLGVYVFRVLDINGNAYRGKFLKN
jgi:hypothetical protein